MARLERLLIAVVAFATANVSGSAQEGAQQQSTDGSRAETKDGERAKKHHDGKRKASPEMQNVRRAIEALSPEQRKRFEENFYKWANLSAEEKKSLRDRDEMRRKRISEDIDDALQRSGLILSEAQKAHFAKRYAEERRKLEEELRQEMNEKRQPKLDAIVGELTKEFSAPVSSPEQ